MQKNKLSEEHIKKNFMVWHGLTWYKGLAGLFDRARDAMIDVCRSAMHFLNYSRDPPHFEPAAWSCITITLMHYDGCDSYDGNTEYRKYRVLIKYCVFSKILKYIPDFLGIPSV